MFFRAIISKHYKEFKNKIIVDKRCVIRKQSAFHSFHSFCPKKLLLKNKNKKDELLHTRLL